MYGATCAALYNCKEMALYEIPFGLDWIGQAKDITILKILIHTSVYLLMIFPLVMSQMKAPFLEVPAIKQFRSADKTKTIHKEITSESKKQ